ncbi:COG4648 family protein [Dongia rigui]|uniref:Intracellular septation protein A n=1 Tax=Dongia rigui TaxID=940149 RepID=A0ABU5E1H2_9PROT|nr:hypothetical protein [Dongia rigui]MDY0873328.1 hypothetical protein [Dongia rigui]
MRFLQNNAGQQSTGRGATAIFAVTAFVYPFLVYLLHERVSFFVFALGASLLLLLRACFASTGILALLRLPLVIAAGALAALSMVDAALAAKAYPALISLMIAALFANSLRRPPSLIERMARMREPDLSPSGQSYCRRLTWVWTAWLVANAAIAAGLAATHSLSLWALWTGLVSYLCTGMLFFGEMLVRSWLLRTYWGQDA